MVARIPRSPRARAITPVQYCVILHGTGIGKYCCRNINWIINTLNNQVSLRHINASCSHICCLCEKYINDTFMVPIAHTYNYWYFMKALKNFLHEIFETFIFATYNMTMMHVLHWQCACKAECWVLGNQSTQGVINFYILPQEQTSFHLWSSAGKPHEHSAQSH